MKAHFRAKHNAENYKYEQFEKVYEQGLRAHIQSIHEGNTLPVTCSVRPLASSQTI